MTTANEILNSPEWAQHKYFTAEEICGLLRMSKQSVYAAVRRGDLPAVRIGKTVRISRKVLSELLGE